jgi:dihydroorotate dehydrogenase
MLLEKRAARLAPPGLETWVAGIRFPNPVGLAAGFDKNALLTDQLPLLGFGFAEIGTVTPRPQKGNPRPRLFRIPEDEAILNRMGFNNDGLEAIARRLEKRRSGSMVIGGNIGKNKDTPNEEAAADYRQCFRRLKDLVDYFTVNVSSPNTPGLRQLLFRDGLAPILQAVQDENSRGVYKPVFLKIAPDLEPGQLGELAGLCLEFGLQGLVATNTTISAGGLRRPEEGRRLGPGGISGRPLLETGAQILQELRRLAPGLEVMSSGGISDVAAAVDRFHRGARLVQVYTGLVYEGPDFVPAILNELKNTGYPYPDNI